jgi:hypothetical protein
MRTSPRSPSQEYLLIMYLGCVSNDPTWGENPWVLSEPRLSRPWLTCSFTELTQGADVPNKHGPPRRLNP